MAANNKKAEKIAENMYEREETEIDREREKKKERERVIDSSNAM